MALYQYASLSDRDQDINRTEIVGHETQSLLNSEIHSNRIDPNIVRMYCNAVRMFSNDSHGASNQCHEDAYQEVPVSVSEQ